MLLGIRDNRGQRQLDRWIASEQRQAFARRTGRFPVRRFAPPADISCVGHPEDLASVTAYTDGACSGNPGPGGWGVLLQAHGDAGLVKERELSGGESATTNNRMELTAAIEALRALTSPTAITVRTDSQYVRNGISKWILGWKANGWRTAGKKEVKNSDLWMQLDELQRTHDVRWEWVKAMPTTPATKGRTNLPGRG